MTNSEFGPAIDAASACHLATDANVVFCDVRFDLTDHAHGRHAHANGHIPGAVYVDLHTDLAHPTIGDAGRHPLPDLNAFADTLGRCGIGPQTRVVAYDDHAGMFAARLWWMLRAIGHTHVAVLDGGLSAWTTAGGGLSTTDDAPAPVAAYPVAHTWNGIADLELVTATSEGTTGTYHLIDVRAPERFRGEVEPLDPVAGHIPGATNLFNGTLVTNGALLAAPELQQAMDHITTPPIVYCGSGVAACHVVWAMAVAGHPAADTALLYPGSWSHWCTDPSRPIATGD